MTMSSTFLGSFFFDYTKLRDHIGPPFLKLSTNGFFSMNRKMNNLVNGRDRFFDFDPCLEIFSNMQIL